MKTFPLHLGYCPRVCARLSVPFMHLHVLLMIMPTKAILPAVLWLFIRISMGVRIETELDGAIAVPVRRNSSNWFQSRDTSLSTSQVCSSLRRRNVALADSQARKRDYESIAFVDDEG